eukprot:jgi/Bigna1/51509/estExt_Genewise1Plus.C_10276
MKMMECCFHTTASVPTLVHTILRVFTFLLLIGGARATLASSQSPVVQELLSSNQTAVLVIDMQNDFCHPEGVNRRIMKWPDVCSPTVPHIHGVVNAARRNDLPVIWINADYSPNVVSAAFDAKLRERGEEGRPCVSEWGQDIIEELKPSKSLMESRGNKEFIMMKPTFNAFTDTSLEEELRLRGIETVVVTGVATSICVESTVRSAMFQGFHTVVVREGVGDLPDRNRDSLDRVDLLFGYVASSLDIIASWLVDKNLFVDKHSMSSM